MLRRTSVRTESGPVDIVVGMTYTPRPGTIAAPVLACLQARPGIALSCTEIAAVAGCEPGDVHAALQTAIKHKLARRYVIDRVVHFASVPAPVVEIEPIEPAAPLEFDRWPFKQRVVPAAGAPRVKTTLSALDAAWHPSGREPA